jgi:hypothetical protein
MHNGQWTMDDGRLTFFGSVQSESNDEYMIVQNTPFFLFWMCWAYVI